jgi:hypothetical protein
VTGYHSFIRNPYLERTTDIALRTMEQGWDLRGMKHYASPETAAIKATEVAEKLGGCVNIKVVPAHDKDGRVRYIAIFSCFSEESDLFAVARLGGFYCFR